MLPIILVFVMLIARDRRLMGDLRSGGLLATIGWLVAGALAALSMALVISQLMGL